VDAVALLRGGSRVLVVARNGDACCWGVPPVTGGSRADSGQPQRVTRVVWRKCGVSGAAQAAKLRLDALRKHRGPRESPFVAFKVHAARARGA
jgi:hypothetical protein